LQGHSDVIEMLIKYGAKLEERDNTKRTALDFAIQEGHLGAVKILLAKGAIVKRNFKIKDRLKSQLLSRDYKERLQSVADYLMEKKYL
jgi:ankyrin repeat protein